MARVRFAPSPTGSLHLGNALSAVANRNFGAWMLLRIDNTDAARNLPGGERAILRDLEWLGIEWEEGPVRQSERQDRYRAAAERLRGARRRASAVSAPRSHPRPAGWQAVEARRGLVRGRPARGRDPGAGGPHVPRRAPPDAA